MRISYLYSTLIYLKQYFDIIHNQLKKIVNYLILSIQLKMYKKYL